MPAMHSNGPVALFAAAAVWTALLAGCAREEAQTQAQAVPEVGVVQVIQQDVPLYSEHVGTTAGLVTAKIQAQVSGYLVQRRYTEGAFVRKGDVLFEIDPRPFRAALDKAKGELGKARAQLEKA
ncbi:MAG: biotin/lipoyl-binding protein, partial [Acidobacteria bacterium]|nr:biotin/lipoyl-binding protein [Acidobacteriota bacterium]